MGAVADDRYRRAKRRRTKAANDYTEAVRTGSRAAKDEAYARWEQADRDVSAAYNKAVEQRGMV